MDPISRYCEGTMTVEGGMVPTISPCTRYVWIHLTQTLHTSTLHTHDEHKWGTGQLYSSRTAEAEELEYHSLPDLLRHYNGQGTPCTTSEFLWHPWKYCLLCAFCQRFSDYNSYELLAFEQIVKIQKQLSNDQMCILDLHFLMIKTCILDSFFFNGMRQCEMLWNHGGAVRAF